MRHRAVWAAGIVALGVMAACGSAPPLTTMSPAATPGLTAIPAAPTPPIGTPATRTSEPSAAAGATDRQPDEVPVAWLIAEGDRDPGAIGGYVFGTSSSSAPWLPATALRRVTVAAGTTLAVELDDRATIASWGARYAAAADPTGDRLTGLGEATGPPIEFAAPPTGDWVVSVVITYGGGRGDGAYYWHLVVR